ncbi:MAG: hypothetical protein NT029_06630 [Armatimonadetes bacterium]|nr:hypothetical protein [Armatimonadota bacterium]
MELHAVDPALSGFVKAPGASNGVPACIGSLSNAGSVDWQNLLGDKHPYQSCPHTASVIHGGMTHTSFGYASGLTLAAYRVGRGRIVLNGLLLRENLSPPHPVAERLLRNLLNWAAEPTRTGG